MNEPHPQRRASFRSAVDLPLAYWAELAVPGAAVAVPVDGHGTEARPARATLRDLSTGGMRLTVASPLPCGACVRARLTVPKAFREAYRSTRTARVETVFGPRLRTITEDRLGFDVLALRGDVVDDAGAAPGAYAYGVRFAGLERAEVEQIARFCHLWQLAQLRARRAQRPR